MSMEPFINGGFFVLSPEVINLISNDGTPWEGEPMQQLVGMGELRAFKHTGFWQSMDTLRDLHLLNDLWLKMDAPWKIW